MTPITLNIDSTEYQQLIAERLEGFFREKEWLAKPYGRQYAALWASAAASANGGKKFRPALVGNTYRHLGGRDNELALTVATAFELLHTAFLLHDDVIDDDVLRRGTPNLAGRFTSAAEDRGVAGTAARGWGEASAILAGDLLIHAASSMVARLDLNSNTRVSLLDLFDECLFVTVAGELADVAFTTTVQTPVLSEVLDMTQWKTAHYSFQAPLQAAAILACAHYEVHQMLGAFGAQIGIAFQLRDDILGVFGDEGETGKSARSDIDAGKITPLMFYALQMSQTDELRELLDAHETGGRNHARVRHLVKESGARALTEKLIVERKQEAMLYLGSAKMPDSLRNYLNAVAEQACERLA